MPANAEFHSQSNMVLGTSNRMRLFPPPTCFIEGDHEGLYGIALVLSAIFAEESSNSEAYEGGA